jgi:hypothetical protein
MNGCQKLEGAHRHSVSQCVRPLALHPAPQTGDKCPRSGIYSLGLQHAVYGRVSGEGWTLSVGSGWQDLLSKVGTRTSNISADDSDQSRRSSRC